MRYSTLATAGLSILLATTTAGRAQNLGNGNAVNGRNGLNISGMAQTVFNMADRNQNSFLSRTEFSTAQLLTQNAVAHLGRAGLIGRGTMPVAARLANGPLGQGGMLGQQGGLFNMQITNTNHVTLPQFTNYFQNAVAQGDAMWRQMYATNRRTNGRAYPRYGRGYGRSAYRNYGSGRSTPSMMRVAGTSSTPSTTTTPGQNPTVAATSGQSGPRTNVVAGNRANLPSNITALGGAGTMITYSGFPNSNHLAHKLAGENTGTKSHGKHAGARSGSGSSAAASVGQTGNVGSKTNLAGTSAAQMKATQKSAAQQQVRARVTAMARQRAAANRAQFTGFSGGGGGHVNAVHMGGHGGGGGGGHGGGGHGGGGHGGGGHGGGHHR